MSYTIRYPQATRKERETAALNDAKQYLGGAAGVRKVKQVLRDCLLLQNVRPRQRVRWAYMSLEFAGLRGTPARAMLRVAVRELKAEQEADKNKFRFEEWAASGKPARKRSRKLLNP